MAEGTVTDRAAAYTCDDARIGVQHAMQAAAILRSVQLAVAGQEDGSVRFDSGGLSRWSPAVGAAAARVALVRDSLMEKAEAPEVDWCASLALLEAFDAALWHCASGGAHGVRMEADEVTHMAQATIEELDRLAQGLAGTVH